MSSVDTSDEEVKNDNNEEEERNDNTDEDEEVKGSKEIKIEVKKEDPDDKMK